MGMQQESGHIPTGMKVKSAILFSIALTILSCPLWRNMPELVRTLHTRTLHDAENYQLSYKVPR